MWFKYFDLTFFRLTGSSWIIIDLEEALERFSIRTYLDWLDQGNSYNGYQFPEEFLNYLKDEVSNSYS